jgi:RimJ/RimL family protein N-acetyltransferase
MDQPVEATDGVVVLRAPRPGDAAILVAGRDAEWERFLAPGDDEPNPYACIAVGDVVVGWVDFDTDRAWLEPGEVNLGYNVFAPHRGNGYASRAVRLLVAHLAERGEHHTATLLIHPDNERSLALADRLEFDSAGDLDGIPYFKQPIR